MCLVVKKSNLLTGHRYEGIDEPKKEKKHPWMRSSKEKRNISRGKNVECLRQKGKVMSKTGRVLLEKAASTKEAMERFCQRKTGHRKKGKPF